MLTGLPVQTDTSCLRVLENGESKTGRLLRQKNLKDITPDVFSSYLHFPIKCFAGVGGEVESSNMRLSLNRTYPVRVSHLNLASIAVAATAALVVSTWECEVMPGANSRAWSRLH